MHLVGKQNTENLPDCISEGIAKLDQPSSKRLKELSKYHMGTTKVPKMSHVLSIDVSLTS